MDVIIWLKEMFRRELDLRPPPLAQINENSIIIYDQEPIGEYDLLAFNAVKKVNIITRLIRSFNYLIWGDV